MKNVRYAIALPGFMPPILLEAVSVDALLAERWAVNCKFAGAVASNGVFTPCIAKTAFVNVNLHVDVSRRPRLGDTVWYEEIDLREDDANAEFDRVCVEEEAFRLMIDSNGRPSVDFGWRDANGVAVPEMCYVDVYEDEACRKADCRACRTWGYAGESDRRVSRAGDGI